MDIISVLNSNSTNELERLLKEKQKLDERIEETQKRLQCAHEHVTYSGYVYTIATCNDCGAHHLFS